MWLTTPEKIEHVLEERSLEPVSEEAVSRSARDWQSRGVKFNMQDALRNMPVVRIGQPESWLLQDLYPPKQMPRPIRAKLKEADFYLVRLSCSFLPVHKESRVEWARFRAALQPHPDNGAQPLAYDSFPQHILTEVKHPIKVTFSPLLKFQQMVEASLGSVEVGFDYTEQVPLVSAAIGASVDPSWDYRAATGHEVEGTKWMYLLVKAPKGLASARAILDMSADLWVGGGPLAAVFRRSSQPEQAQLVVNLWG